MSVFERFSKETDMLRDLEEKLHQLCITDSHVLVSLTINQCNAAYGKYGRNGKPFTEADLDTKTNSSKDDYFFHFGSVFAHGYYMLKSYLEKPELAPSDSRMKIILSKLLEYLLNQGQHGVLTSFNNEMYECDLTVRLAEHFFSRLGVSSSYTIDKYYKYKTYTDMCSCGCKAVVSNFYGDTTIGNVKSWHGSLDLMLNGCFLPVAVIEGNPDSPGGKSSIEVKVTEDLELPKVTSQLLSQTIVFSFLERKKHPEYKNFLIPSIGVSTDSIIFHFYDSENDVLLKSTAFPLLEDNGELNFLTVLATWFVVNYKFLCSGFTKEHLENVKKAKFFDLAECLLPVYREELSIGRDIKSGKSALKRYQPCHLTIRNVFKVPEEKKFKADDESSKS